MDTIDFDLAVAWTWEHDAAFVECIRRQASTTGLSVLEVTRANVEEMTHAILSGRTGVRWLLDRASDEDERFIPLAAAADANTRGLRMFNRRSLLPAAVDKATMHLEFLDRGIAVPYTVIVPPFAQQREVVLPRAEAARLGGKFILKPATTTGGGTGVVLGAQTQEDVDKARQGHPNDKYLVQETIRPVYLGDNRAWFRVFYAWGDMYVCWWDDLQHVFDEVTPEDEEAFALAELRRVMQRIHSVCRLDFFSTELAMVSDGTIVAVDYVNEICDMRLQSMHPDGVVDRVVEHIAASLVRAASS